MISAVCLIIALIATACAKDDLLIYISIASASAALLMIIHPLPTLSESMLVLLVFVLCYTGAAYLLRRAVVYLSEIRFGKR